MGWILPPFIALCGFIVFYIVGVPVHEAGHLVCGLASGYRFVSYRVGAHLWTKQGDKVVYTKAPNRGIAGQCLMAPPERFEEFRFVLYNLGGGLFNILLGALLLAVYILIYPYSVPVGIFFYGGGFGNLALGLMNLIPMVLGIPNDGTNIFTGLRTKEAKRGMFLMLRVNQEITEGKRYRDYDDAVFKLQSAVPTRNYLEAYIVSLESARLADLGRHSEAAAELQKVDIPRLTAYYRNGFYADLCYDAILYNRDFAAAATWYDKKGVDKQLQNQHPTYTRVRAAYTFFVRGNTESGRKLLQTARAQLEAYPSLGLQAMETDYLNELEARMNEAEAPPENTLSQAQ